MLDAFSLLCIHAWPLPTSVQNHDNKMCQVLCVETAVGRPRRGEHRLRPLQVTTSSPYFGYIGIMEKKMETTITDYIGIIWIIWGLYRDNGKENGSCYNGLYIAFRICGEGLEGSPGHPKF